MVLGATIVGFVFANALGLEAGTIALFGAAVLMLLSRLDVESVLHEIEWPTIFFFIGLFMLVEAVVEVGIIDQVAQTLIDITAGDATVTTLGLIWLSGIASGIVDNIPYTATMIPVVEGVARETGMAIEPLWWALALGACLGGNYTIVGASANVVVANLAGKAGHPISFRLFFKYGSVVATESLIIATVYVYLRYLMP
jgi:Na+/H+ antiporter NhaD/arsenite permease-like protein